MIVSRVDAPNCRQLKFGRRRGISIDLTAEDSVTQKPESRAVAIELTSVGVGRVVHITCRTFGVVDLGLEEITLPDHRRIQLDAGADREAPFVIKMTRCRCQLVVVGGIDLVQCAHDLRRAPCLIDAKICDDVRRLETTVLVGEGVGKRHARPTALDLSHATHLGGNRRRDAVAELCRVTENLPATVTGVRGWE